MTSRLIRALTFVGSLLATGGAMAADIRSPLTPEVQETTTESGWTFLFAPYFWAAGLSGDVAQFGLPEAHVDASFSDIFDHLDFGAMAIGEARYGPYSIFGDVMYTKISGQTGTPRGILATDVELTSETSPACSGWVTRSLRTVPGGSISSVACACGRSKANSPSAAEFSTGVPERMTRSGWMGWPAFAAPTRSRRKST